MSTAVVAMVMLGAICWVFRGLFIVLVPAERLPVVVREALGYLAPAVLAALVAVETDSAMQGSGVLAGVLVVVAVATIAVAVRLTGSLLLAVAIGLAAALFIDLVVLA
jgi:branched-subunit amino acid transport protein